MYVTRRIFSTFSQTLFVSFFATKHNPSRFPSVLIRKEASTGGFVQQVPVSSYNLLLLHAKCYKTQELHNPIHVSIGRRGTGGEAFL